MTVVSINNEQKRTCRKNRANLTPLSVSILIKYRSSLCVCLWVDCPSHFLARKNHVIISTAQRERVAKRARDPPLPILINHSQYIYSLKQNIKYTTRTVFWMVCSIPSIRIWTRQPKRSTWMKAKIICYIHMPRRCY